MPFSAFLPDTPYFVLQCTHQSVSDLRKLTPSENEGVNFCKRLTIKCVRCSGKNVYLCAMTKILFICLGNICRSPMAEAVFGHLAAEAGRTDEFVVASAAVSEEEWGNPIYPPAAAMLRRHGIPYDAARTARQMKASDYQRYDLIIAMDESNIRGIRRITGGDPEDKIHLLLDYAGEHRSVADPWYTRDFETAYDDILRGCRALLESLLRQS